MFNDETMDECIFFYHDVDNERVESSRVTVSVNYCDLEHVL